MFGFDSVLNQLQMFFVSLRLCWEVNSAWLITELANQRARKALFTCVVYNVMYTPRRRWKGFSELAATKKPGWHSELETFLYSHANKIHLQKKGFALSLFLKVRIFVTQK